MYPPLHRDLSQPYSFIQLKVGKKSNIFAKVSNKNFTGYTENFLSTGLIIRQVLNVTTCSILLIVLKKNDVCIGKKLYYLFSIISIVVKYAGKYIIIILNWMNLLQCVWSGPWNKWWCRGKHLCNLDDHLRRSAVCLFNWKDAGDIQFSVSSRFLN